MFAMNFRQGEKLQGHCERLQLTRSRLAHRLRDMQTLPFVVVTNPHMSHVYELYYKAFETLRRVGEIRSVDDNDRYCAVISQTLREHLTVIPKLAMGVIECQDMMPAEQLDHFMNTLLRSVRDTHTASDHC